MYFYLGDAILHYLIDEFQDTAPIQWEAMKPLFAEALSKKGSLFLVGDTKQSIYAFRHADWRIMKNVMETIVFPSAPPNVKELEINYRSFERILDFNKTVFHDIVPNVVEGKAPHASGLSSFKQQVKEDNEKKGYVEVVVFEKDEEKEPDRSKILEIVTDCKKRGYRYGDITILTAKNKNVIAVSGWLNSKHIPFISHSSLDIRGQSITGEIIALLSFLDSPIDDLAFTTFLLSGIFHRVLGADGRLLSKEELASFLVQAQKSNHKSSLYSSFRTHYVDVWKKYFDELFHVVGYLPMYDLVSHIYKQFRLFELAPEEEGTLARFLEVMKNFEETGQNNIKDFLAFAEEEGDDSEWNIAVPRGEDAVSVMTIHKAKGLDNRVIIVLLVDSKQRADNLFIEDNEEGVRLVHITQKDAEYNDALQDLYRERRFERDVDNLNKLYVAFTRAKEEMYVINVKNEWADEPSKYLPQSGFDPTEKPKVTKWVEKRELKAELHHSSICQPAEIVSPERLALYERRRGEAIHDVLSRIKFVDTEIKKCISLLVQEIAGSWMEPVDAARIQSLVLEFLRLPEIEPFFTEKEGRNILNEQEFVSPDGRLFRMDRIVVDTDSVTVIDFKTGDDKDEVQRTGNQLYGNSTEFLFWTEYARCAGVCRQEEIAGGCMSERIVLGPNEHLVETIAAQLGGKGKDLSDIAVVFPGKRPAHFLRKELARRIGGSFIPPKLFSVDEFILSLYQILHPEPVKDLEPIDAIMLLFQVHSDLKERLGGDYFSSLDSFIPVGLKLFSELEELRLANLPEKKIREELTPLTYNRLFSLPEYYTRFYKLVSEKKYTTRAVRYVEVAEHIYEIPLTEYTQILVAGLFKLTHAETDYL